MSDKKKKGDEPSYAAASAELDAILEAIESGAADLDQLYEQVERAAALLAFCRDKLAATETKVKVVVEKMAKAMGDDERDGGAAGDGEDDA
jgi:exodeoxyribonuclease VII small subunit